MSAFNSEKKEKMEKKSNEKNEFVFKCFLLIIKLLQK